MDIIAMEDLTSEQLWDLLALAEQESRQLSNTLQGMSIALVMLDQSTRTRLSTLRACTSKGGNVIEIDVSKTQTPFGESFDDMVSMITLYNDCVIVRDGKNTDNLRRWRKNKSCPIINALNKREHPTQALADLLTIYQEFHRLGNLALLYAGPINNTSRSLCLALAKVRIRRLAICAPTALTDKADREELAQIFTSSKTSLSFFETLQDVERDGDRYDVFYACRWASMGEQPLLENWRDEVAKVRVNRRHLESIGKPSSIVMHDLPAHRGEEIEGALLDCDRSRIMRQARNKIFGMAASLDYALGRQVHQAATADMRI
jgi:ornithine carbamoyltransferase